MIEVGYCFENTSYMLASEPPKRITVEQVKGFAVSEQDTFFRCPAVNNYIRNTYIVPLNLHGDFTVKGFFEDDTPDIETNIQGVRKLQVRRTGEAEYLIQLLDSGITFFSDIPDVHALVQAAPDFSERDRNYEGLLDTYTSIRFMHPSWSARVGEKLSFTEGMGGLKVTFITKDNEPVNLVPCSRPDLLEYAKDIEQSNHFARMLSWKNIFKRIKVLRPRNQIDKFRLDR